MIGFLLNQTCTIYPWVKESAGEDVYGGPETRKCRIQHGAHLRYTFINPDGVLDQVEARAKLFCTGPEIPTRSRIECDGHVYIVIDVNVERGFGYDHLEAYLQ